MKTFTEKDQRAVKRIIRRALTTAEPTLTLERIERLVDLTIINKYEGEDFVSVNFPLYYYNIVWISTIETVSKEVKKLPNIGDRGIEIIGDNIYFRFTYFL